MSLAHPRQLPEHSEKRPPLNQQMVQCLVANQEVFKQFFHKSVSQPADAEDLFQKLLVKALKLDPHRDIDNLLAYGYRMAQHLIIDHHREQQKSPASLEHDPECQTLSLEAAIDHEQRVILYQKILGQMSPLRRDIFIRRRLHGQSRQAIAETLGISEEAVKKHISRAMETLRSAMTPFFSSSTCPRRDI